MAKIAQRSHPKNCSDDMTWVTGTAQSQDIHRVVTIWGKLTVGLDCYLMGLQDREAQFIEMARYAPQANIEIREK
jgi:hypothetical protein